MHISVNDFGTLSNGGGVKLYTLEAGDISLSISDFGAIWTSLMVPSKKGRKDDLLLGFSTLSGYLHRDNPHFGSTIGRFANRVAGAAFSLGGKNYTLYKNDGNNSLHGGRRGFSRLPWKAESYTENGGAFVRFELESPDGDEGYPGTLRAAAVYGVTDNNEIRAVYEAKVDAPSPVNLTNHAYFNLAGEGNGNILSHEVTLFASSYVEPDSGLIPTGRLVPVEGTPFDFRSPKPIARDFPAVCGAAVDKVGTGYDHCFVVDGTPGTLRPCAKVREPVSGRELRVSATQPGIQFYTGNFLDGVSGKSGSVYNKNAGFCLETEHFPDSPNQDRFPDAVFGPGRDYREEAVFSFEFSTEKLPAPPS
ncbi:MAG: galactose mutarotase [Treponema sp.]|jgi:aldose 1-epimerase|nr:galactose mutarotase [Treponema sp.]